MSIGQELLNVPMGDMIRQMALAIAEGQMKLDASSIEVAEMMGGLRVVHDDDGSRSFDDSRIFFGYEVMTVEEAQAYIAADDAITGGDPAALTALINSQIPSGTAETAKPKVLVRVPTRMSMLELGFSPTFYQFVDTIIEVRIAVRMSSESQATTSISNRSQQNSVYGRGGGLLSSLFGSSRYSASSVTTSQVDASYANRYSYSAEGSSLLRTKLVPLPPPAMLDERIRRQMEEDTERRRKKFDKDIAS